MHHLVARRQVRDRRGDLRVCEEADLALHEPVQVQPQAPRVAEERLLAQPQQPARVVAALDDHVGRLPLEHAAELGGGVDGLVGRDLDVDLAPHVREPGDIMRRNRLLHPVEVVLGEPPDPVDRGRGVPRLVRVDPQQRPGPDRLAHRRDARVVVARTADLHVDHLVVGELACMRRERLRIVALEEAEEVEIVVDRPAEEGASRNAERAAERIPARDLDPRHHEARELRRRLPAALGPDRPQDRLDVAGRAADDLPRHQLPVRDGRAGVLADRLAVAGDALVRVHSEQDEVRSDLRAAGPVELLRERDRERCRLDPRDPHRAPSSTTP